MRYLSFGLALLAAAPMALAIPAAQAAPEPGDWTWNWRSNVQSQNGLVNVATNGNLCVGLVGVLAPANSCGSS